MNMQILLGPDGRTGVPDTSEDEDGRRGVTFFSKSKIGLSYKCPSKYKGRQDSLEYGFYFGKIELEAPVQSIYIQCSQDLIDVLEKQKDVSKIVFNILKNNAELTHMRV